MKKLFFCILAAACAGCLNNAPSTVAAQDAVRVEVSFTSQDVTVITRSADEQTIKDVNFYLFAKSGESVTHVYARAASLQIECQPGEYDLYVAANLHADLGNMTVAQLESYTLTARTSYADLPMSAKTSVTITAPANGGAVSLPVIELRRCVAKVAYNIRVDKTVSDIQLQSAQVLSIPRKTTPFAPVVSSTTKADYINGCFTEIPASAQSAFSGVCYLFENMQGRVAGITSQSGKSPANAPACASCILIRAVRGNKVLAYTVYLGENNTDNFDIKRNTSQTFDITIHGDSEVDTRITSYTLAVYDDIEQGEVYGGYCVNDPQHTLYIQIEGENNTLGLTAEMEVTAGDGGMLGLDRTPVGYCYEFRIDNQKGMNYYELDYSPKVYDATNSELRYNVSIYDELGFCQTFEFAHKYANSVRAYTDRTGNGKGDVTAAGVLYSEKISATKNDLLALCDGDGCVLTATPSVGYRFEGWYSDPSYTKLLTTNAAYAYKPASCAASLFPKFVLPGGTPLDANGTANCYIAPALNARYSFDATVQGNGKATLNITPKRLSGTQAKVIWETGTERGAVVSSAEYIDGRICFTTGSERGNALVGLFDTAGNCIWSWHIWAVDYTPASSAQTYVSGAVFMDRNLGALTTDYMDVTARGLYYQWGRKDPFPGPAVISGYTEQSSPTIYLQGFEYVFLNPEQYTPSQVMTVDYAAKHPTTYINAALYPEGSDKPDIPDWLYTRNPHLWGNQSTKTTISTITAKTIYDPCPQGWRVPDLEDFKNITFSASSTPYCTSIRYRSSLTTEYPLGGYFNGAGYLNNGNDGYVHTCSTYTWSGSRLNPTEYDCSSIHFNTKIGAVGYFRHAANPVRCVRE